MNKKLKSKKENTNKGITLIALIITIIVLLILAVVAIRAVTGDGILAHARNARDKWIEEAANEEALLGNLTNFITEQTGNNPPPAGEQATPMKDAQNKVLSDTENTKVKDDYGNILVVPAGFKIVVDDTTTYADKENPHVTDGIVIEDESAGNKGSQFVWVPIGEVKTDKNGAAENIIFGRYSWDESTGTVKQSATVGGGFEEEVVIQAESAFNYTEKLQNSESKNAKAKDIVEFCTSVTTNGGYYIGRYEAGNAAGVLVCKRNQSVYGEVTQASASEKCQAMYSEEKPFTSDLVNSYAWDTAIAFIQQCGTEKNASTYAKENMSTGFKQTGKNGDQYRNINDMSGNAYEWTTETCDDDVYPCGYRGGCFGDRTYDYTKFRDAITVGGSDSFGSFRPLLYL